jgi:ATP-dependent Lon protease
MDSLDNNKDKSNNTNDGISNLEKNDSDKMNITINDICESKSDVKNDSIPTIIIEDDFRTGIEAGTKSSKSTNKLGSGGRRKIFTSDFTKNNPNDFNDINNFNFGSINMDPNDKNSSNINFIDMGSVDISNVDPLSLLFTSLFTSMAKYGSSNSQTNRVGDESVESDGSDTSDENNKEIKEIKEIKENKEENKEVNKEVNKKIPIKLKETGVEDMDMDMELEEKLNNNNIIIDFASTIGDINTLNKWLERNLDSDKKFIGNPDDYTVDSIDYASSNGKINVLNWWKKVNNEYNVPLKYTKNAINLASKNGLVISMNWWIESGLELKYDFNAIDYASNTSKIPMLNWWIDNLNKEKVRFEYSSNSIDKTKLDEDKLLILVKWWKVQRDENNIKFKYSKIFIDFIHQLGYHRVYKYLVSHSMIRPEDRTIFNSSSNSNSNPNSNSSSNSESAKNGSSPMIGLFELFGGSGLGSKKTKESYRDKIDISKLPEDIQTHIKEKEEELNNNMLVNGKAKEYIDNLIKIPFGKYKNENIFSFIAGLIEKINNINSNSNNKLLKSIKITNESELITFFKKIEYNTDDKYVKLHNMYKEFIEIRIGYIRYVEKVLDDTIYGHESVKKQIKCIIAQWLSGGLNKGVVIGMQGPPGVGKTTVIKGAISKCLVNFITYSFDEPNPFVMLNESNVDFRPFCFMSLGGTTNGSTLVGHNITYHGATSGDIVKNLKEAGVMNPILYFDELDKISNTEHGHEISSVLTHITDPVQNEHFTDRYFSEVKIDLSRCIMVFSYNDTSKIDRILLDRIQEIKLDAIRTDEKIHISKKFLIPEICKNIGYNPSDFIFSHDKLTNIITDYTHEAGVRKLKEKLQEIIRMKHLERIESKSTHTKIKIADKFITDTFADYPKMNFKKIMGESKVGYINGMYATTTGIGGITVIQVKPIYHKDILGVQITGSVEKVMSESIQVAKTVAYNLLSKEEKIKLIEDFKDTGLHVHCPEGATPKDGPSAGTAITSAIYSVFTGKPILNDIAITGEMDLDGNVTMIGGLDAKLTGAKRAGVKLALVPKENTHDIEVIKRKNPTLINKNFKVKFVSHISEVINIIFN